MSRVPPQWKILGLDEKHILKKAFRDVLPPSITGRTKHPYRAPIQQAFAGRLADRGIRARCSRRRGSANPASSIPARSGASSARSRPERAERDGGDGPRRASSRPSSWRAISSAARPAPAATPVRVALGHLCRQESREDDHDRQAAFSPDLLKLDGPAEIDSDLRGDQDRAGENASQAGPRRRHLRRHRQQRHRRPVRPGRGQGQGHRPADARAPFGRRTPWA